MKYLNELAPYALSLGLIVGLVGTPITRRIGENRESKERKALPREVAYLLREHGHSIGIRTEM